MSSVETVAEPLPFPPAQMTPCHRITTRAYDPHSNKEATIHDVLVIMNEDEDDDDSDSDESMIGGVDDSNALGNKKGKNPVFYYADDYADGNRQPRRHPKRTINPPGHCGTVDADAVTAEMSTRSSRGVILSQQPGVSEYAYWLQRVLCKAIYGQVRYCVKLKRRYPTADDPIQAEWELMYPRKVCAVKIMVWDRIRTYRERGESEDPIKEVAALQYLSQLPESYGSHHVMSQLDLVFDDRYLYSVLPYCAGGELFDYLDKKRKLSEDEARFWAFQMLQGLLYLREVAGISHRDVSLENFLMQSDKCLVIDMGMCLRVAFRERQQERDPCLIPKKNICGKWFYMSPEVLANEGPFDGFAIDIWAVGVIIYMMLMGSPPFERAHDVDPHFKCITQGNLRAMLVQGGEVGLSEEVMDLMQKLLTKDPSQRLTVYETLNHPWLASLTAGLEEGVEIQEPNMMAMDTDRPWM